MTITYKDWDKICATFREDPTEDCIKKIIADLGILDKPDRYRFAFERSMELNLSNVCIQSNDLEILGKILDNIPSLQSLHISRGPRVYGTCSGMELVNLLCSKFQILSCLDELEISGYRIEDEGVSVLMPHLSKLLSLKKLSLYDNNISNSGATTLFQALPAYVTQLRFKDDYITSECFQILEERLPQLCLLYIHISSGTSSFIPSDKSLKNSYMKIDDKDGNFPQTLCTNGDKIARLYGFNNEYHASTSSKLFEIIKANHVIHLLHNMSTEEREQYLKESVWPALEAGSLDDLNKSIIAAIPSQCLDKPVQKHQEDAGAILNVEASGVYEEGPDHMS